MRLLLFWLAVIGWTAAVTVHILSLFDIDAEQIFPYIWLLHFGIFLVWVPMIFILRNEGTFKAFEDPAVRKKMNPLKFFRILAGRTPDWVIYLALAGFIYAFINFGMTMMLGDTPAVKDGQYYLHNRGHVIRYITEAEYHYFKAIILRRFSGHWIAFFGIAAALLYPFAKPTGQHPAGLAQ